MNISMENAVVIKMLNNLDPTFETFLTVKNNEARNNDDLPDINKFITAVEQEENQVNLASLNLT